MSTAACRRSFWAELSLSWRCVRMGAREVRDAYAELHAVSLTLSFG